VGTSLTIARIGGTELRVHWSFVLILAWGAVIYGLGTGNFGLGALYGILVVILLFVCVTLHEFGHAFAARRYGISVPSITLLPIGGVASLERAPEQPRHEFVIAIAGPLVNVALALLLLPVALALNPGTPAAALGNLGAVLAESQRPGLANLVNYLLVVNLMLALFNLIPAFPMDGGRVLRSILAMFMGSVAATRTAVLVGRLVAVPMAIWGIMSGNILLLLIAFFIYVGGGAEREAVESRTILRSMRAGSALSREAARLYTSERLDRAVSLIVSSYQADYPVFDLGNNFVGVLTRPGLVTALRLHGEEARVVDVMTPAAEVPVVAPEKTLADVWELMAETGSRVVAVKRGSEFLGLINTDDVNEVFHVMRATMDRRGEYPPEPPPVPAAPAPNPEFLERDSSRSAE
jgi:stage IV sporulation protein FB